MKQKINHPLTRNCHTMIARLPRCFLLTVTALLLVLTTARAEFPVPSIPCNPERYRVQIPPEPPTIDGRGDDAAWDYAAWTDPFVDIRGREFTPRPRYDTRVKMLQDTSFFYIYAWMDEPHLWATYARHDMVIYHENDFEVFIDPDGDNHHYLELEVNALGTTWDLMLTQPYRDGGHAIDSWEIPGLELAIHLEGTLNDPSDIDTGWGVEMAIPWDVIDEVNARKPASTDIARAPMRVNFSRVQWRIEPGGEHYVKQTDPATGKPYLEDNWVWSPQGLIAMHYPEMWGVVEFMTPLVPARIPPPSPEPAAEGARSNLSETLIQVYYAQRQYHGRYGVYAPGIPGLLNSGLLDSELPYVDQVTILHDKGFWRARLLVPGSAITHLSVSGDGRLHSQTWSKL